MRDDAAIERKHIKIEVMRAARTLFADSFRKANGRQGLAADV